MNVSAGAVQPGRIAWAKAGLKLATVSIMLLVAVALFALWPGIATVRSTGSVQTVSHHYQSGPQAHIGDMAAGAPRH